MNKQKFINLTAAYILIISLFAHCATVMPDCEPKIIDTCGKAMLLDVCGNRVLLLSGTHYQMGFQQGKLLKYETQQLVRTVLGMVSVAQAGNAKGYTQGSIKNAFDRSKGFIDARFHDEMRGLADGAELELEDVQLANIFPELFHCSGFALFGDATAGKNLLHGRILDYMTEIGLQNYAVVTIAKPEGYNSFATVGYAGFIGSVTGMNQQQIAIGEMGGKGEGDWDGMPMSFLVRKALEEAQTLEQAVDIFRTTPRTCEYYYVISDGKIPDARGLACTPKKFDVVAAGQEYEKLPTPVKDALLLSAGDRYGSLVSLVQQNYGKIDTNIALDLMNRPVAMNSCLHRVLFEPQTLNFWVSNAIDPVVNEQYAAHSQPYYHYSFNKLCEILDAHKADNQSINDTGEKDEKAPANELPTITGVVPAALSKPCLQSQSQKQQLIISRYEVKAQDFEYIMKPTLSTKAYQVYQVSFPSPFNSPVQENNTVYCEYYDAAGSEKRPAVILLDILDGSMIVSRLMANSLAHNGVNACIMTLPYYGSRRPADLSLRKEINSNINMFLTSVEQSVMDVRRTAAYLASLENIDSGRIGICGTSLGGFIAALSAGVDGNFKKAAIVLAGGDLACVLTTDEPEVRAIGNALKQYNIDANTLKVLIESIEPLTFADRLAAMDILMINGTKDKIVPRQCSEKLAQKAGAEIFWYETDHYGMAKYMLAILDKLNKHFAAEPAQ